MSKTKKAKAKNTKTKTLKTKSAQVESFKQQDNEWFSTEVFTKLALIFLFVQALGLFVAKQLLFQGMQQAPFGESIDDLSNSFYLFGVIIAMTVFLLILMRLRKTRKILFFIEAMAIFSTSLIVFSSLLPTNDLAAFGLTALVLLWRYTHIKDIIFRDFTSLICIAGAGAFIGISLGLFPILAFIIILAIYDIIAVFYTKHMVEIGKTAVGNNFAFTVAIPTKKHVFELGNGDLVIPLMVASSIMVNGPFTQNWLVSGLCLGASFIGLMTSIYTVSTKRIPLPALPPQTLYMVLVIIVALLMGF